MSGSKVPPEWRDDQSPRGVFTMNRTAAYRERAADESYPPFLRVHWAAVGNLRADGHAPLPPGGLANLLGGVGDGGGWVPASAAQVRHAVSRAIEKRLITNTSCARCLIPLGEEVVQGWTPAGGQPRCRLKHKPRAPLPDRQTSPQAPLRVVS